MPSVDQLLKGFSLNVPILVDLINAGAALIGFLFIFRAFLKLKIYGEMRSMMAPHARLNQVILLLVVGTILIYVPYATTQLLADAIFGQPYIEEMPYVQTLWTAEIQYVGKTIMKLIGRIALVKGMIQIGTYQEGGRHSLSKSVTHILAGMCAINIEHSLSLLMGLFELE